MSASQFKNQNPRVTTGSSLPESHNSSTCTQKSLTVPTLHHNSKENIHTSSNQSQRLITLPYPSTASTEDENESQTASRSSFATTSTHSTPERSIQLDPHFLARFPPEIRNRILHHLCDVAFTPGLLFPSQYNPNNNNNHTTIINNAPRPNPFLLALNHDFQQTYQTRMWAENTWIIGPGAEESTRFLDELPDAAALHIKKIHITFSTQDLPGWQLWVSPVDTSEPGFDPKIYDEAVRTTNASLEHVWWGKLEKVKEMRAVEELTLDLAKAYGVDGSWLGERFVGGVSGWRDVPGRLVMVCGGETGKIVDM
ncbi:MAG: hypothetical protein LQ352_004783 [Teloschistes flavicans]|nr:MAG: hypothetical protein LQ352_004783 [Teloschistes flavicans]